MNIIYGLSFGILWMFVLFAIGYIEKSKKNAVKVELYEKLRWCFDESISTPRDLSLKSYIYNVMDDVESQYRFRDEEPLDFIDTILGKFNQEQTKLYFSDSLSTDKKLMKLSCEEYFFYTLFCYLKDHINDDTFCEQPIRELSNTTFKQNGQLNTVTYCATGYGLLYRKLYYTVARYCELNENVQSLLYIDKPTQKIKKLIDEREITITSL